MINKHAYLIVAHAHFDYLKLLLKRIDYEYNDIYIHIDKKSKFNINEFQNITKKSKVFFIKRMNVNWGGNSLIQCEYRLLKTAFNNGKYSYYHLISGDDILLRQSEEIYKYFEQNGCYEYISLGGLKWTREIINRIDYFYFFQEFGKRKKKLIELLEVISLKCQKSLKIHRVENIDKVYAGSNWFSITDNAVKVVLLEWNRWKRTFRYSYCGDELFLQTILMNSSRKDFISEKGNLRKIDWTRGSPYSWKKEDLKELLSSNCLFARKINYEDSHIIYEEIDKKVYRCNPK